MGPAARGGRVDSLGCRFDDALDQLLVGPIGECRHDRQIGMLRMDARQRIDLDETEPTPPGSPGGPGNSIRADIHASAIATTHAAPDRQGQLRRLIGDGAVSQRVFHARFALFLVEVGVNILLGIGQERHFEHPHHFSIFAGPDQADRELATGQIRLDQHRLPEFLQ